MKKKLYKSTLLLLLLFFFAACGKKDRQIKVIAKHATGDPIVNAMCSVYDNEQSDYGPEIAKAYTNNAGEAILDFKVKSNHTIAVYVVGTNCSPGSWLGDAKDVPSVIEFNCQ